MSEEEPTLSPPEDDFPEVEGSKLLGEIVRTLGEKNGNLLSPALRITESQSKPSRSGLRIPLEGVSFAEQPPGEQADGRSPEGAGGGERDGRRESARTPGSGGSTPGKTTVKPFTKESLERLESRAVQLVREYGFQPRRKLSVEDGARLPRKFEPFPKKFYGRPLEEIDNFIYDEDLSQNETPEEDNYDFNESAENSLQYQRDDASDPLSLTSTKSKAKNKVMTRHAEPRPPPEPPKKISKTSASSFTDSVLQLQDIARMSTVQEDEYDRFALHIGAQLRKLPERSFVLLQGKIQNLITQESLRHMTSPYYHNEPSPGSSYGYGTPPPHSPNIIRSFVSHEEPITPDQQANVMSEESVEHTYEAPPQQTDVVILGEQLQQNNFVISEAHLQQANYVLPDAPPQHGSRITTSDKLKLAINSIKDCFD